MGGKYIETTNTYRNLRGHIKKGQVSENDLLQILEYIIYLDKKVALLQDMVNNNFELIKNLIKITDNRSKIIDILGGSNGQDRNTDGPVEGDSDGDAQAVQDDGV